LTGARPRVPKKGEQKIPGGAFVEEFPQGKSNDRPVGPPAAVWISRSLQQGENHLDGIRGVSGQSGGEQTVPKE
jgi:hypothetical protein